MSKIETLQGVIYNSEQVEKIRETLATSPTLTIDYLQKAFSKTNFGFHLGRLSGAADIIFSDTQTRYLIYQSYSTDLQDRQDISKNKIPHFPVLKDVRVKEAQYAICPVPYAAQPLDNRVFKEQSPVLNYLGAFEILGKSADVLALLYGKTHKLPFHLALNRMALTTGVENFIRIVPPYQLVGVESARDFLTATFINDLREQDPINEHSGQIDYFFAQFNKRLELI